MYLDGFITMRCKWAKSNFLYCVNCKKIGTDVTYHPATHKLYHCHLVLTLSPVVDVKCFMGPSNPSRDSQLLHTRDLVACH